MMGFFGGLGAGEIIAILALGLLLFGAKRLPELARGLGSSFQEFKKGLSGEAGAKPQAPAPHASREEGGKDGRDGNAGRGA